MSAAPPQAGQATGAPAAIGPSETFDVLIVGAGISGIGAAHHLGQQRPGTRFAVLESQPGFGGTWLTHRYPGTRSDSDLFTFGYRFKPWIGKPIASREEILAYLGEVIEEGGLGPHIRYRHAIASASWSSEDRLWTLEVVRTDTGERLRATYFDMWPGIWVHGDRAVRSATGGVAILGRSDATLNVGGVRIGTSEIYAALADHPVVADSLAFGQEYDGDTRIILLVVTSRDAVLDEAAKASIKSAIRTDCSPRHVPAVIVEVADLPRTQTGKISEIAVREAVHGREVKGIGALADELRKRHCDGKSPVAEMVFAPHFAAKAFKHTRE